MSSLLWTLSSSWFKECPHCRIEKLESFNNVVVCQKHREWQKVESEKLASLEPTEENIREIINGRIELFACKGIYEHFYEKLIYDMPYGTAKARTGDPDEYIYEWLCEEYSHLIEEESA